MVKRPHGLLLANVWFPWKKGYKHILISNKVKPLNFLRNALQINSKQTTFLSTDSFSFRFFLFSFSDFDSKNSIRKQQQCWLHHDKTYTLSRNVAQFIRFLLVYFSFRVFASLQYCLYVRMCVCGEWVCLFVQMWL